VDALAFITMVKVSPAAARIGWDGSFTAGKSVSEDSSVGKELVGVQAESRTADMSKTNKIRFMETPVNWVFCNGNSTIPIPGLFPFDRKMIIKPPYAVSF
jgi:hypothetical protein